MKPDLRYVVTFYTRNTSYQCPWTYPSFWAAVAGIKRMMREGFGGVTRTTITIA